MNVSIIHVDGSFIGFVQCPQYVQQGAFPGAGWPYNGGYLPFFDFYINSFQYFNRIVPFIYVFSCNHAAKALFKQSNIHKTSPPAKPGLAACWYF
jgi:hypothetical protein